MKPWVLVFDYDGTLCRQGENILSYTVESQLKRLQENHKIILATGRPRNLIHMTGAVQWDAEIYGNGAECIVSGNVVERRTLVESEWKAVCSMLDNLDIEYYMFSNRVISSSERTRLLPLPQVTGTEIFFGAANNEPYIYKLIMESSQQCENIIHQFAPHAELVKWNSAFWKLHPKSCRKSNGIQVALQYMGARWDDVIAFGDSENDYDVFEKAAVSVSMGTLCEKLCSIASCVSPSIGATGLDMAIVKLKEIGYLL